MERMASAYGWSPAIMAELSLDDFEAWGAMAEARLQASATAGRCPWARARS